MRYIATTLALVVALAVAGSTFAAVPQAAKKTSTPATHTAKGTVKSLDNSSLVVSHKGGDMTFVVDNATAKTGSPAVGSEVSVKYHTEGKTNMATAITAQPPKQQASAKPAASKKTTK